MPLQLPARNRPVNSDHPLPERVLSHAHWCEIKNAPPALERRNLYRKVKALGISIREQELKLRLNLVKIK